MTIEENADEAATGETEIVSRSADRDAKAGHRVVAGRDSEAPRHRREQIVLRDVIVILAAVTEKDRLATIVASVPSHHA